MFGLTEQNIALIKGVFSAYPSVEKVYIFGSRAMGNETPVSDIDLVFWGELKPEQYRALYDRLENLPLPYKFDLKPYADIEHRLLKDHIDRQGQLFYKKTLEN